MNTSGFKDEVDLQHVVAQNAAEAARKVTAAEDRLRREIAELLHGPVQTKLLMIWYKLGRCQELLETDPAAARALLQETRDEVDRVREKDVRHASHVLHPSIIGVGLTPALKSLTDMFEGCFAISVSVDPAIAQLDQPLRNMIPEVVRLTAYRVAEEGLNNVYRHARANKVELRLRSDGPRRLTIEVRDDGQGFDAGNVPFGLGLTSIAWRVDQLGGSWQITSTRGKGTVLSASLPLGEDQPRDNPGA